MPVSENQKKAAEKYIKAKRDRISLNAPKGRREAYTSAGAAEGLSLNAWIIKTCDKAAAEALQEPPQPPTDAQTPTPDV